MLNFLERHSDGMFPWNFLWKFLNEWKMFTKNSGEKVRFPLFSSRWCLIKRRNWKCLATWERIGHPLFSALYSRWYVAPKIDHFSLMQVKENLYCHLAKIGAQLKCDNCDNFLFIWNRSVLCYAELLKRTQVHMYFFLYICYAQIV